ACRQLATTPRPVSPNEDHIQLISKDYLKLARVMPVSWRARKAHLNNLIHTRKELTMMKLGKQSIPALSIALLFAASAAIAQNPRFEELDADGDGYISKTEARAL